MKFATTRVSRPPNDPARPASPRAPALDAVPGPTIASRELFRDAIEIRIDHDGVIYRLRRTALGKLILTK